MHGTEMTLDSREQLVVDNVIKLHFETTLLGARRSYILGVLSSTQYQMEFLVLTAVEERADGYISAGELEEEASDFVEGFGVQQLAETISATREEHCEIVGNLHGENLALMYVLSHHNLLLVHIVLCKATFVSAEVDALIKRTPLHRVDVVITRGLNFKLGLEELLTFSAHSPLQGLLNAVDLDYVVSRLALFRNSQEILVTGIQDYGDSIIYEEEQHSTTQLEASNPDAPTNFEFMSLFV